MMKRDWLERTAFLLLSLVLTVGAALPSRFFPSGGKAAGAVMPMEAEQSPLPEMDAASPPDAPEVGWLIRADYLVKTRPAAEPLTVYPGMEAVPLDLADGRLFPQTLTDLLLDAIEEGPEAERDTLLALLDDRELSREEFFELTGYGSEDPEAVAGVAAVLVDGDDDGIPDIAADLYFGGSGGFTEFTFFKGTGDGTYQQTSAFSSGIQEFGFIQYGGVHYLVRTSYDYSTKETDGLDLYLYRNGEVTDALRLYFEVTGYDRTEELLDREGAAALAALDQLTGVPGRIENSWNVPVLGNAEMAEPLGEQDQLWHCDLDNDGIEEAYRKRVFLPSNAAAVQHGEVDFQEGSGCPAFDEAVRTICGAEEDLRYYTFWVDRIDGENVSFLGFWNPDGYTVYACRFQRNIKQE